MDNPAFVEREKLKRTCDYLYSYIPEKLDYGLILGSFLHRCTEFLPLQSKITLNIDDIPHISVPTVPGHKKNIIFGKLENKNILIFLGRLHFYEGYSVKEIVYPINLLANFFTDNIIVTNSAGGINPGFAEDDVMIIKDHINFMFDNPFFGYKYSKGYDYFLDMSCPYDKNLAIAANKAARDIGLNLKTGTYAGVKGPILETRAEIDLLYKLGADAVGMSTVQEVIMANFLKIKVLGLSHIRNITKSSQPYSKNNHDNKNYNHLNGFKKEIIMGKRFAKLIENIIKKA